MMVMIVLHTIHIYVYCNVHIVSVPSAFALATEIDGDDDGCCSSLRSLLDFQLATTGCHILSSLFSFLQGAQE